WIVLIPRVTMDPDPRHGDSNRLPQPLLIAVLVIGPQQRIHELPGMQVESPGSVLLPEVRPVVDGGDGNRIEACEAPAGLEDRLGALTDVLDGEPALERGELCCRELLAKLPGVDSSLLERELGVQRQVLGSVETQLPVDAVVLVHVPV